MAPLACCWWNSSSPLCVSTARDCGGAISPSPEEGKKKPTSLSRDIYIKTINANPTISCMRMPKTVPNCLHLPVVSLGINPWHASLGVWVPRLRLGGEKG